MSISEFQMDSGSVLVLFYSSPFYLTLFCFTKPVLSESSVKTSLFRRKISVSCTQNLLVQIVTCFMKSLVCSASEVKLPWNVGIRDVLLSCPIFSCRDLTGPALNEIPLSENCWKLGCLGIRWDRGALGQWACKKTGQEKGPQPKCQKGCWKNPGRCNKGIVFVSLDGELEISCCTTILWDCPVGCEPPI